MAFFDSMAKFGTGLFDIINQAQGDIKWRNEKNRRQKNMFNSMKELKKIKDYRLKDLYQKINFGENSDSFQKYRLGDKFFNEELKDNEYEKISKKLRDKESQFSKNYSLINKQLVEGMSNGLSKAERAEFKKIFNKQKSNAKQLNDTLLSSVISKGVNPFRTKLTQLLIGNQKASELANQGAIRLYALQQQRKKDSLYGLQKSLSDKFNRDLVLAREKNRVNQYNLEKRNEGALQNWRREKQVADNNVALGNEVSALNRKDFLDARRTIVDSKNNKRQQLANLYRQFA